MNKKSAERYAEQFNKLIPEFIRAARNQEAKRIAQYSLTLPQFYVIALLDENGPCMMSLMGESLGLTLGTLTGIIDRLVREGLVERCADEQDRRIVRARLTPKGEKLIARINLERVESLSKLLEKMDDKEIAVFTELLGRVGTRFATREDL
jgi:MarR family transcriptional regulator, 2-MHQ and catechol-resistance regulon repressor